MDTSKFNAKLVRDAIASLDGKIFATKQEVEDAIYPLWAKLSIVFHGEGHRDLVDRLISARWLEALGAGKGWKFFLPAPEKFATPVPDETATEKVAAPAEPPILPAARTFKVQDVSLNLTADAPPTKEVALTLDQIGLMHSLAKGGVVMSPILQSLIDLGLVVQTYTLTDAGQRALAFANTQTLKFKL